MSPTEKEEIVKELIDRLEDLNMKQLNDAIQLLKRRDFRKNLLDQPDFNAALTQFIYLKVIKVIYQYNPSLMAKNDPQLSPLEKFLRSGRIGPINPAISLKLKMR